MNYRRLNTYLFFIGVFATALVIHESYGYSDTIEESLGAATADLIIIFIAYNITMRMKKRIISKRESYNKGKAAA